MSADLLRRAAALMRERAEASPIGSQNTWHQHGEAARGILVRACGDGCFGAGVADAHTMRAAEHIASWHPAVALAVADWLDGEADACGEITEYIAPEALAVARAYLGEQP